MPKDDRNAQVGARDAAFEGTSKTTAESREATRRSSERSVVSYLGIVMLEDHELAQVDLVDLSAQGARMVASGPFDPDGEFVLKVPETGAKFVSEVVWRKERTYGVRFLRPS